MDFTIYKNRLSQISARLHLMVLLVFGLLFANILLTGLIWQTYKNQRIEITPFFTTASYIKSPSMVDANYLDLMTKNFIYARLNVTPETVKVNHETLLHFVDATSYSLIYKQLQKEALLIQKKKISSSFDITRIRTQPKNLTAEIEGILRRYVGIKPIKEKRITYMLAYRYKEGRLSIQSFTQKKEQSNA